MHSFRKTIAHIIQLVGLRYCIIVNKYIADHATVDWIFMLQKVIFFFFSRKIMKKSGKILKKSFSSPSVLSRSLKNYLPWCFIIWCTVIMLSCSYRKLFKKILNYLKEKLLLYSEHYFYMYIFMLGLLLDYAMMQNSRFKNHRFFSLQMDTRFDSLCLTTAKLYTEPTHVLRAEKLA